MNTEFRTLCCRDLFSRFPVRLFRIRRLGTNTQWIRSVISECMLDTHVFQNENWPMKRLSSCCRYLKNKVNSFLERKILYRLNIKWAPGKRIKKQRTKLSILFWATPYQMTVPREIADIEKQNRRGVKESKLFLTYSKMYGCFSEYYHSVYTSAV